MLDFEGDDVVKPVLIPMPHRLKKEHKSIQGICIDCEAKPQKKKSDGTFFPRCWKCIRIKWPSNHNASGKKRAYKKQKKDYCEECGFKGHPCQLDVDHVDGDHSNDDPINLQTLCANCHRLKTWRERQTQSQS